MRFALVASVLLVACSNLTAPPAELGSWEGGSTTTTAASAGSAPTPGGNKEQAPSMAIIAGDPETELKIEDTGPGTGPQVKMGDAVQVHYAGKLKNGQQFDASKSHQPP